MSVPYFFLSPESLLFQWCVFWLQSHGVAPVNSANIVGAYLTLLTHMAQAAGGV